MAKLEFGENDINGEHTNTSISRREMLIGIGAGVAGVSALVALMVMHALDNDLDSYEIRRLTGDIRVLRERIEAIVARDLARRTESHIEMFDLFIARLKENIILAKQTKEEIRGVSNEEMNLLYKEIVQFVDYLENTNKFPQVMKDAQEFIKRADKDKKLDLMGSNESLKDGTAKRLMVTIEERRKQLLRQLRTLKSALRGIPEEEETKIKDSFFMGNKEALLSLYASRDLLVKDPSKVIDHVGEEVGDLQKGLKELEYYAGEIDNKYSSGTRIAHIAFLRDFRKVEEMSSKEKLTDHEVAIANKFLQKLGYYDQEHVDNAKTDDEISQGDVTQASIMRMNTNFGMYLPARYWQLSDNEK